MKPTFALDLTRETIGLLHRTPKGWLSIGEVAFDAPDLAEALDYLRKTALGLSPMGVATKLILPNSQILYTEVHAPGPSRDEKRRQIAAALEGRTPYPVEDLVFDWSGKGATVKVAVVARETLAEAEAFAVEHRLNPVSFVAIPEDGTFVGEPWFGPTEAAASLLAEDETVERDREPVSILHRELPKAAPVAEAESAPPSPAPQAETVTEPAAVPAAPSAREAPAEDDEPLPGLEEALNADLPTAETASVATPPETSMAEIIDEGGPFAGPAPSPAARVENGTGDVAVSDTAAPAAIARGPEPRPEPEPEPEEAPFAHVTDAQAFPEGNTDLSPVAADPVATRAGTGSAAHRLGGMAAPVGTDADDIPPAPPSAAMVAFASRRAAAGETATRPVEGVTRPAIAARTATARPATAKGYSGLVTAPSIPGTRAKVKVKGGDIPRPSLGPTTVKSPARPGGTFGAAVPAKRRGGTVFMIMVGLLLLFLALVAAWASYFMGSREAARQAAVTEAIPDASDEMLADLQDPDGLTEPLPEAGDLARSADLDALATERVAADLGGETGLNAGPDAIETDVPVDVTAVSAGMVDPEPAPEPAAEAVAAAPAQPAPEPAPDTTLTTEVAAASAPVEDQDEIFLSTMDAPPPALDALALPPLVDLHDSLPDPVMPPPAPGTVYQFDAAGLLKPTPEGILSPDGVFLIAGKPPLLPPSRSEVASAAAQAAAAISVPPAEPAADAVSAADASLVTAGEPVAAEVTAPSDPEMAGFRPRPRPEGLTPAAAAKDDDASLGTAAVVQFATLRPLPRPASVTTAAAAVLPASATPADLGAQGASLTAQAEAKLAEAAALEARNPSIVAISMRPAARPQDMSRAVEAAVAAAVREPAPAAPKEEVVAVAAATPAPAPAKPEEIDELDEPAVAKAAPSIPTKASVAKQATFVNAINLSKINLIGTYGTDSRRYALIRQSNGKYKKVTVGDKIDGGTIKAITETEVRYQKGGRLISLKMPKA
ncbi:MAG: hypothetical protein ACK4FR_06420 [Tabrizicola sp.]